MLVSCNFLAENAADGAPNATESGTIYVNSIQLSFFLAREGTRRATEHIAQTNWRAFVHLAASFPRLQTITIRAAHGDMSALRDVAHQHLELLAHEHLIDVILEESDSAPVALWFVVKRDKVNRPRQSIH